MPSPHRSAVVSLRTAVRLWRRAAAILRRDQLSVYAAQASFFLLLSAIPLLVLILNVSHFLAGSSVDYFIGMLRAAVPADFHEALDTLLDQLEATGGIPLLSITAFTALWSASRGMAALERGLGGVYGIDMNHGFFRNILRSLLYTAVFILLIPATLLLLVFGTRRPIGMLLGSVGVKFIMHWTGGNLAASVVAFPLMYRTARGAFESFDETLAYAGQTLGLSNRCIFWRIRMPYCKQGILAGTVLAFARALGEYGATSMLIGYTPNRTATISTSVYQYWRTNDAKSALFWVGINLLLSAAVLLAVNLLEKKQREGVRR